MIDSGDIILVGIIAAVVQIVVGIANGIAAKRAVDKATNVDILAEVTIGKNTVKFDKSDILALALAVFIFWAVGRDRLDARDGLAAFVAVLTGTGVKEMIEAWYPGKAD